jgi:hypothetical protein
MGQVLAFNSRRKAREEGVCPHAEQYSEEVRARLNLWVAKLTSTIADLEKVLAALNTELTLLPASQRNFDLEDFRTEILIQIYKSRRFLSEI